MERPLPEGVDPTRIEQYLHNDEFTVRSWAIMDRWCSLPYDKICTLCHCVVFLQRDCVVSLVTRGVFDNVPFDSFFSCQNKDFIMPLFKPYFASDLQRSDASHFKRESLKWDVSLQRSSGEKTVWGSFENCNGSTNSLCWGEKSEHRVTL